MAWLCLALLLGLTLSGLAAPERTAPASPSPEAAAGQPGDTDQENTPPEGEPFSFAEVVRAARGLSQRPYENPDSQVPGFLLELSADQWNKIRFDPGQRLWADSGPFSVEFFHPGFLYNRLVRLHIVDQGRSEPVPFSPAMFDYADSALAAKAAAADLNFAGFRLYFPLHGQDIPDEVASFLGASYYRAVGRHATYGLSARGLALDTALPDGEEFPYFREFWLEKPAPDASAIRLYALMDSPSLTGAFTFTLTPGTSSVMDVESVLFRRRGASWPLKIGLAPISSMFLHSEMSGGARNDYRPEVHNSDGLLYRSADEIWHWRPLTNPGRLAVSSVPLENPRGFGLMQRDTDFDHYQDIGARFERRGSLWVEPTRDWGPGRLELIEIPSREDFHDNVTVFWVPDASWLAREGAEEGDALRDFVSFSYRLYWMTPGVTPHGLGKAVATWIFRSPKHSDRVVFILDFEGEALKSLPPDTGLSSLVESPAGFPALDKQLIKNPVTGGWRLQFSLQLPQPEGVVQSLLAAHDGQNRLRVRALLKRGENFPDALTETWVFDVPY
ncbi:MAG: glucan biosynthesis protein [Desulfovibrionaceae bacterium]|nr:glucan biosynthesis protein [Desulfovibrionaceae bacterium]